MLYLLVVLHIYIYIYIYATLRHYLSLTKYIRAFHRQNSAIHNSFYIYIYIYIYISRYIHLSIHILPYLFSTLSMCLEQNLRHTPLTLCLLTHHFTYHSFRYISIYLYSLTIDPLVQFTHTFFFYISLYRYITLEVHTQHIPLYY